MDRRTLIRYIFENINVSIVPGRYASWMINGKYDDFMKFLCNFLSDETIIKWFNAPNDEEILFEIAEYGYQFYNHVHVGNVGYEWVENYI